MKKDSRIILAFVVLAGLMVLLLVVSMQRNQQVNKAIATIQGLQAQVEQLKETKVQVVNGRDGYTPVKGVDYFDGANGVSIQGNMGPQGIQGPVGPQGPQGAVGLSAYDIWKLAGNDGDLQDFLVSLKGEKGDPAQPPQVQVNPETGDLEFKNAQDFFWQVWMKKCEVRDSCDDAN